MKGGATAFVIVSAVVISTAPLAMALTGGRMGGSRSSSSSSSAPTSSRYRYNSRRSDCPYENHRVELDWKVLGAFIVAAVIVVIIKELTKDAYTVIELQVGTRGVTKYLQEALNKIAETADTSSPTGWAYILGETTKTLCQKLDRCISSHSYVKEENVHRVAMHLYHKISISESLKFDEETLVNTNVEEKRLEGCLKSTATDEETLASEYAVVIFVLAVRGAYKLPTIRSSEDLEKALKILQSIPATKIEALEVLWAPQQCNDILTEKGLHERYPTLTPLLDCLLN